MGLKVKECSPLRLCLLTASGLAVISGRAPRFRRFLRPLRSGLGSAGEAQAAKESPQPQVAVAFGFSILKPDS